MGVCAASANVLSASFEEEILRDFACTVLEQIKKPPDKKSIWCLQNNMHNTGYIYSKVLVSSVEADNGE
jgi:hypothetical protein